MRIPVAAVTQPADVFLPGFRLGSRAALDFAVSSGLRIGSVFQSADDGCSATLAYEARKRAHLDTDRLCRDVGVLFLPMVIEASGGAWGPTARSVWSEVARAAALLTGVPASSKAEEIGQLLSVILHRENALAIIRRVPAAADAMPAIHSARAALRQAEASTTRGTVLVVYAPGGEERSSPMASMFARRKVNAAVTALGRTEKATRGEGRRLPPGRARAGM